MRISIVIAAVFLGSFSAVSEPLPAPDVAVRDITAGGRLVGCSIEFSAAFRDHIYKQGKISAVTGSINLMSAKQSLMSTFKLVGVDFSGENLERFKVATASLFEESGKPYKPIVVECEDDRSYCAAMAADAFLGVTTSVAMSGSIRMGFSRTPEGLDVPITLPVQPDLADDLLNCARNLAEQKPQE